MVYLKAYDIPLWIDLPSGKDPFASVLVEVAEEHMLRLFPWRQCGPVKRDFERHRPGQFLPAQIHLVSITNRDRKLINPTRRNAWLNPAKRDLPICRQASNGDLQPRTVRQG